MREKFIIVNSYTGSEEYAINVKSISYMKFDKYNKILNLKVDGMVGEFTLSNETIDSFLMKVKNIDFIKFENPPLPASPGFE